MRASVIHKERLRNGEKAGRCEPRRVFAPRSAHAVSPEVVVKKLVSGLQSRTTRVIVYSAGSHAQEVMRRAEVALGRPTPQQSTGSVGPKRGRQSEGFITPQPSPSTSLAHLVPPPDSQRQSRLGCPGKSSSRSSSSLSKPSTQPNEPSSGWRSGWYAGRGTIGKRSRLSS